MLLLEDSSTVANLDAFQGVSLRVSVDGSGVASIESINVPDGREGGILTQRKTNEVALRAISMETEDPVEALLQGTATKPEPGSLVVQFGGFLDESNARWMELSVHEVESGVVLVSISEDGTLEFFTTSLSNDLTPLRR